MRFAQKLYKIYFKIIQNIGIATPVLFNFDFNFVKF